MTLFKMHNYHTTVLVGMNWERIDRDILKSLVVCLLPQTRYHFIHPHGVPCDMIE